MAKRIIIIIVFLSLVLVGIRLISGCGSGGGQGTTTVTTTTTSGTHGLTKIFFLHQSTGHGLITTGNMRGSIEAYNLKYGTSFGLWDFWSVDADNYPGLVNSSGEATRINLYEPTYTSSQTDPESLFWTWTGYNSYWTSVRTRIMDRFQVIAFKSCFGASNIDDASALQDRKNWYLAMRDFFDQHPEKLFVVMSFPPQTPLETTATQAGYARAFANWLKSAEYRSGHPNVVCFDLFYYLAKADDGSADANMLQAEYRLSDPHDSHPKDNAYGIVGPKFAEFLINAALNY